jgi:tetratricopeptide (TPR) repeat protein
VRTCRWLSASPRPTLLRQTDDKASEANTWDSIGYSNHELGNYAEAVSCFHRALELWRTVGDRYYEADTYHHLGDTHAATGELGSARESWQRAVEILSDMKHTDFDKLHAKLDGLRHRSDP